MKAINEKRATWVEALDIARQDQGHRNTQFIAQLSIGARSFPSSTARCTDEGLLLIRERTLAGRPGSWRIVSSHLSIGAKCGFIDVFFLSNWPHSERQHHRDQQEIRQTPAPHFQHGQGQGEGRHVQDREQGKSTQRQGTARKDIENDGKGDDPKDRDLKQDLNMWMRKPSVRKRLLLLATVRRASVSRKGIASEAHHASTRTCAECGIGKPVNECDCVRGNQIR